MAEQGADMHTNRDDELLMKFWGLHAAILKRDGLEDRMRSGLPSDTELLDRSLAAAEEVLEARTALFRQLMSLGWTPPETVVKDLAYDEIEFDVPIGTKGDCYDRYLCRLEELRQSVRILEQCIANMPDGPYHSEDHKVFLHPKEQVLQGMEQLIHQFISVTEDISVPAGEFYFGHENPKGEFGFYVVSRGGPRPHRVRIHGPSFSNLQVLPHILPGCLVSDIVAILGSIDFVMGECDR